MQCVSSVTYSIIVNGSPCGYIHHCHGLRQKDLILPYLFLLYAEGLSALIDQCHDDGVVQGIFICRGAPPIHHSFFVDDCLLFGRATKEDCFEIKLILNYYKRALGQQANLSKSAVCFSWNITRGQQDHLASLLGIDPVDRHVKYLSILTMVGRNQGACFSYIK